MGSGIFFFHVCQEFGKSSQLDHASWTDKCGSNRRLPQCLFFFFLTPYVFWNLGRRRKQYEMGNSCEKEAGMRDCNPLFQTLMPTKQYVYASYTESYLIFTWISTVNFHCWLQFKVFNNLYKI